MPNDNDRLLREIHETVGETGKTVAILDDRSEKQSEQIGQLFSKAEDTGNKISALNERTKSHAELIRDNRLQARKSGGVVGGSIVAAWGVLQALWREFRGD